MCGTAGGNRKGYAGYENDGVLANSGFYHVRNRVYHVVLRWLTRDPLDYVDRGNLYWALSDNPLAQRDAFGLLVTEMRGPATAGIGGAAPGSDIAACTMVLLQPISSDNSQIDLGESDPISEGPGAIAIGPGGIGIGGGGCADNCRKRYPQGDLRTACIMGCRFGAVGQCKADCEKRFPNPIEQDACIIGCKTQSDPGGACARAYAACKTTCQNSRESCLRAGVGLICHPRYSRCLELCACLEMYCRNEAAPSKCAKLPGLGTLGGSWPIPGGGVSPSPAPAWRSPCLP